MRPLSTDLGVATCGGSSSKANEARLVPARDFSAGARPGRCRARVDVYRVRWGLSIGWSRAPRTICLTAHSPLARAWSWSRRTTSAHGDHRLGADQDREGGL